MSPLLASLLLVAQAAEPAEPERYGAVGANPFWGARIGDGRMIFETPGRAILDVEAPPRQETEIGFVHWTRDFAISVEHANCTDPLTRRIYADRVTVRVGETQFEGCGGRALSPALPAPYAAAGGEPFWWVDIDDGRITFQVDDRVIIVAALAPLVTGDGGRRVYRTPALTVSVRRQNCDLEDDRTYADTVRVTAGGRTVEGCGGAVVREAPE